MRRATRNQDRTNRDAASAIGAGVERRSDSNHRYGGTWTRRAPTIALALTVAVAMGMAGLALAHPSDAPGRDHRADGGSAVATDVTTSGGLVLGHGRARGAFPYEPADDPANEASARGAERHASPHGDEGEDTGHVPGNNRCPVDPSARSLRNAFQHAKQQWLREAHQQYHDRFYALHYEIEPSYPSVDAGTTSATIHFDFSGSVRVKLTGQRESAHGSGTIEFHWVDCGWTNVSLDYETN